MDQRELKDLSRIRLKEATALLQLELFDGAFYLAGYAVECGLKACIAKGTRRGEFPDKKRAELSHTHNLIQLIKVAGLEKELSLQAEASADFRSNWNLVKDWSEQSRYQRQTQDTARALLAAVSDRRHGVIIWIKRQW